MIPSTDKSTSANWCACYARCLPLRLSPMMGSVLDIGLSCSGGLTQQPDGTCITNPYHATGERPRTSAYTRARPWSPTSDIPTLNPNGIPTSSPGLRGTSYPGKTGPKYTTPTGLRPGSPAASEPTHCTVPQASSPAISAASRRPNLRTGRARLVTRSRVRLRYRISARIRRAQLSLLPQSLRVPAVPQGRPRIAQHFSAGFAAGEPQSPVRDDRGVGATFPLSLPRLNPPPPPPQH